MEIEKVISSFRSVDPTGEIPSEYARKIFDDLKSLLTSVNGVNLLKQQSKNFEVVLPLFIRIIFHPDPDVSHPALKVCDVVFDIFRSKLPKIKKEGWWMKFEMSALLELVDSLKSRIDANDDSWVAIWTFVANVVITETLNVKPLNVLLAVSQHAFQKGKDNAKIKDKAWLCWKRIIDAFGRYPKILIISKTINLLMKPLLSLSHATESQISTWVHLIEVKGISGPGEVVKSIIDAMCKAMYKSGEKSACRTLPDACANALIKVLSHDHVMQHCLSDVIEVFGACVSSRPSAGLIEQLTGVLVQSINDLKDDGMSYKVWKALTEQVNTCPESPILSIAYQKTFTDINFIRWIDSGTIEGKEIAVLMDSCEFREKVLLRSIKSLTLVDQAETPSKRKNRKGSSEDVWSNYCEAYVSWWSNQSPPSSPKESENREAIRSQDSCDYQAAQFLLLQPVQLNMWNPTISKTWSLLCEVCHKQKFLQTFIKAIFDAVDEPNFELQKAIDVSDCLYKLDSDFCKQSAKLLETISSTICSMEFQSLLDVLNLSETVVLYPEMSTVLSKICKGANEKCADYDQLNAHKIKTKVGKIMRKLEQLSNSAEKEKPAKAQRTPFRAQSNFLQRLAKAEEKNKTKSPFLTSIFSSAEKGKNGLENDEDALSDGAAVVDTLENGVIADDNKKPVNLDDSEIMPIITLPSVLKGVSVLGNGHAEGVVAEKENMMLSAVSGVNTTAPTVGSPRMKITNAREVKSVDASSPAAAKKPKPVAGQKSTPKKVTPSKVSYFDDDANDYVMVPPKPKTTPLTEHQMEMMSKRRTDIPALYQDLSQDTQSQHVAEVQEVTTGVSPRPIQESQDIVPGTPSPEDRVAFSTPEPLKSAGKMCTSAKKLDFNNLSTPPSKNSLMNGSFHEMSPTPELQKSEGGNNLETVNGLASTRQKAVTDSNEVVEVKEEQHPAAEEKSKRKRKSEPSKFSPKLTRSKKNLKSATPDAKLTRLTEPPSKVKLRFNPPDPVAKSPRPNSPEPADKSVEIVTTVVNAAEANTTEEKKKCNETLSSGPQERPDVSIQVAEDGMPSSQNKSEVPEPLSQDTSKKGRKRKIVESPDSETPKKVKTSGEDCSSATKKCDSAKKKKKPFKLGAGGNLENWLVKTERVPTPVPEPDVKCEKMDEIAPESEEAGLETLPNDAAGDLDNSEEIVPSTQECLVENHKPLLPVLETKADEKYPDEDVLVKIEKEDPKVAVPDDADKRSPEKPEGSVLERLSHESPNDDDIALVISPSRRQRRAPSVFRGEGDTYLSKEKFYTAASAEPDEDSKVYKVKNKTPSPTSKKRLQPLGGRSAKMLRLATSSTTQEDNDNIVVTPIRRRESIAPVKYGENWPKGHIEDWVAYTPASPYMSPFRSALKKTPGVDENTTPQRMKNDSLASPLLSSAKRKRVMFLDPPVTRGLAYETDSPGGSLHHADVPQGSPYPTWKCEDPKMEISPSKRDAERLNSLADLKADALHKEGAQEESSPSRHSKGRPDLKPYAASDVSDEVRRLINPAEPTIAVSSPEPNMNQFQEKYKLSDDFMTALSETDEHLRSLLIKCFGCSNMAEIVDAWKFGDCRRICRLPHSFLRSVKNLNGEVLTDTLASGVFTAPTNTILEFTESCVQTEQPALSENSSQTRSPLFKDSDSQTVSAESRTVGTSAEIPTSTSSTQADMTRPTVDDWPSLLQNTTPQEAVLYFSDSLRVLSSSLPNKK